ncbi:MULTISPECIES: BTAD domain-containing putative transcriptional regulator [unclassified Streptomyces]|uniref:AfsR/SARP family transcriptional regulator n=1 Tax=unclassified Streptomyces TaxID=2593676 RepID=UPI000880DD0C|nr:MULTISPECIES: BTAD domain-containing putative transcriptional regulator [unclassified Streptomyces]PBC84062.1 DNA-binding SARP family transcriptional activator [Streptomyces sp. 2321.6]SDR35475.1 DNA-binding transcriptional activator of the SARP family [Streptomyces sp. KS_16]SED18553.1 DNA-binding transcriptional activator of the SARP family [Streptomyces sp. 2133.1]SNC70143.1 DNA-binding transcriptional activator of the SARP family [Streptomyces sp. 2114.4]
MDDIVLRLLGPVELVHEGRSLDLGGPRQRVVLAMLGLNINRTASTEQLIDAVWGDSPPTTARGQIQVAISTLRKQFARAGRPGAITTRAPGYVLGMDTGSVDSLEFDRLVARAREDTRADRIAEAAATLHQALELWRGPALDGLPNGPLQHTAAHLNVTRLTVLEERVRLDLMLARHEEVCAELTALIGQHPLRERLYELLILALYRSGRQAEALEAFQRARKALAEELGIEPGPELRDLAQAVLRQSPALDLPASSPDRGAAPLPSVRSDAPVVQDGGFRLIPRQLPASIGDFTGRHSELDKIKDLLEPCSRTKTPDYAVPIVDISGPGGVGKSALAVRAAYEVSKHFPDGLLYADLHTASGDGQIAALLARFLRALEIPAKAIPDDAQERAEMYRSRLAESRVLVVLDGVTSPEQVTPLLPGSATCAVIITSRARLAGVPGVRSIDLTVFDMANALELLAGIIGRERVQAELDTAVELVNLCDALPLALRIAGARLASHPHWRIEWLVQRLRDECRRLDELSYRGLELRSTISLTYRALPPSAQRLFRLFSLVQAPASPAWVAAALLDCDFASAEDILDLLVEAQVMDTVQYPGSPRPCYRFHDLVRAYAREELCAAEPPEEQDAALARVLGGWLSLVEEAHREEYGGDYTIIHGSAKRWRLPESTDVEPVPQPMTWRSGERQALVTAVRQAAAAGMHELCWDLALSAVTLFEAKGYFDDWEETTRLAHEASARAGNRIGQAAMLYSLGTLHMFQTRMEQAEECFGTARQLFEAEGHDHGRALVLRNAAHLDSVRGDDTAMREKYDEALAITRLVGDRIGEAHIMRSLAGCWLASGNVERARTLLEQALTISREEKCRRVQAQVLQRFAELHLAVEQPRQAQEALQEVLRIVRSSGDRIGEAYALYGLGAVRRQEKRLDSAADTLARALILSRQVGERVIEAKSRYALAEIALTRGDYELTATHLEAARDLFAELGSTSWLERTEDLMVEAGCPSAARSDGAQPHRC